MNHLFHYLALVLILTTGLVLLLTFRFHPLGRPLTIAGLSLAYFTWGIAHHHLSRTLHRRVVLEYLSLSILGAIIIATLL
ncbi:MAG: hypothetical protein HY381_02625 [Candidatus Chisholmbacteria bacterium]|nr:hypothetical protein [Candidatus Chisholmbacteria bacterium]